VPNLETVDAQIRAEADSLLKSGLIDLLGRYGEVHLTGSYALGLMTWRDLDIHIVRDAVDCMSFFGLGGRIADLLQPHRMHYRDERIGETPRLPRGLYWGIYLGDERKGAWKIDVWTSTRADFEPSRRFCADVQQRLTAEAREKILAIKSICWQHPEYRRSFSSADIYEAVLDNEIKDADGFWTYLASKLRRRG
jgi:hypothetical protein